MIDWTGYDTLVLGFGTLVITVLLAYSGIRASLRLQEEHLKNELKVRLYPEIADALHRTAEALQAAALGYEVTVGDLKRRTETGTGGSQRTSEELADRHRDAARQVTALLMVFEKYEIVFARFAGIRRQFADEHLRLLTAHSTLFSRLLLFLPSVQGTVLPHQPRLQDVAELEVLAKAYRDVEGDLQGYILDASVEAQNELLGDLFKRQLPSRNPLDSSVKVLKRDYTPQRTREPGRW